MFVNAFQLPKTANGIVHFPGTPRQYRADCKAGILCDSFHLNQKWGTVGIAEVTN